MTREDLNPTALANAMVHLASFDWCGPHQTCVELCEFSTLVAAIDLTSKQFSEQANALHFSEVLGSQLAKRLKLLHSDTSSAGCFCDSYGPAADLRVGCAAECGCFGRRQVSAAKIVRLLNNYSASDAMSENLRKLTAAFSFTTAGSSAGLEREGKKEGKRERGGGGRGRGGGGGGAGGRERPAATRHMNSCEV
jgi:hypothetical protein